MAACNPGVVRCRYTGLLPTSWASDGLRCMQKAERTPVQVVRYRRVAGKRKAKLQMLRVPPKGREHPAHVALVHVSQAKYDTPQLVCCSQIEYHFA